MEELDDLKRLVVEETDLFLSFTILVTAAIVNVVSLLPLGFVSFEQTVYLSLIAISLSISSYLFFRLRKELIDDDTDLDVEGLSADILHSILREIKAEDEPTKEKVQSLLTDESGIVIHKKREAYNFATSVLTNADEKLLVLQKTPIFLLGARPYDSQEKDEQELRQFEELGSLIENTKDNDTVVYCGFMPKDTRAAIEAVVEEKDTPHLKRYVAQRLYKLCQYSRDEDSGFKLFVPGSDRIPIYRFIASESQFALWFTDPSNDRKGLCAMTGQREAIRMFRRIFEDSFRRVDDYETACEELGLTDVEIDRDELEDVDIRNISLSQRRDNVETRL